MPAAFDSSSATSSTPPPSGTYSVGGTVTGLGGSSIMLSLNGGSGLAVAADGVFTFPTSLASGTSYVVTVQTQPTVARELCGVVSGSGTVETANVTNVSVNCSAVIGFLYQIDNQNNQIESYGISAGTGLPIAFGSPVATSPAPAGIAVGSGGSYLYVTSTNITDPLTQAPPNVPPPGSISTYAVNRDSGQLTAVGPPLTTGTDPSPFISSAGFLFVSTTNGATYLPTQPQPQPLVMEYALDPASGAPSLIGTFLVDWANLAVTPDGRFLYALTGQPSSMPPSSPYTLTVYAIDPSTGALTQGQSLKVGNIVGTMTFDPLGRFLYLTNSTANSNGSQATGIVLPYAIDATTGAVTALPASSTLPGNMGGLATEPTGNHLYLINDLNWNAASDTIEALSVASTGTVSAIGSIIQTNGPGSFVNSDPSGQFVYVASGYGIGSFFLTAYLISTDPATAGQLMPSGQPLQVPGGGEIAIIE